MSGGRVELGLGTGWFEAEHHAYGIPFPLVAERFDRLQEQLDIITGLWQTPAGQLYSYTGKHYALAGAPALARPAQEPRPPVIIGGKGPRRTPALAARYADEYNIAYAGLDQAAAQFDRVRAACAAAGRDPGSVIMSATLLVCCGRTEDELGQRAAALDRDVASLRATALAGRPAEVTDAIGAWAAVGAGRLYLAVLDLSDLDQLELVASEVAPAVAGI
jgi:alkanesulfonate monooxygenase SsuD/methylene tetrahydromethanopterin reductase-like flavin-dependent oxidoreductase (luciferase family)